MSLSFFSVNNFAEFFKGEAQKQNLQTRESRLVRRSTLSACVHVYACPMQCDKSDDSKRRTWRRARHCTGAEHHSACVTSQQQGGGGKEDPARRAGHIARSRRQPVLATTSQRQPVFMTSRRRFDVVSRGAATFFAAASSSELFDVIFELSNVNHSDEAIRPVWTVRRTAPSSYTSATQASTTSPRRRR